MTWKHSGTQMQREYAHAKTEAEIGVTQPEAKEHVGSPEAGRGKESLP